MNKPSFKITNVDLFALINTLFFLAMCYAAYFDRFIHYRGRDFLWEFFVYAVLILAVILVVWRLTRHIHVPAWLLICVQIGIALHFAGGLAILHETRLYDKIILGIRYDKYVHMVNSFLGGIFLHKLYFKRLNLTEWLKDIQLMLTVLGLGTLVEMVEYLVTLTITVNGVGDYDNNMQDLISNFIGVTISLIAIRIMTRKKEIPAK